MITKQATRLLTCLLLSTGLGCGAHAKPTPNDEVSAPLNEEDQEALEGESEQETGRDTSDDSREEESGAAEASP